MADTEYTREQDEPVRLAALVSYHRDNEGPQAIEAYAMLLARLDDKGRRTLANLVAHGAKAMLAPDGAVVLTRPDWSEIKIISAAIPAASLREQPTASFNEAKATILAMSADDARALAITQFAQLQMHEKYGNTMENMNAAYRAEQGIAAPEGDEGSGVGKGEAGCQSCDGTGSGGMGVGCTDCLGTGRDPAAQPCPDCGGTGQVFDHADDCAARTGGMESTSEAAIAAWNRRPPTIPASVGRRAMEALEHILAGSLSLPRFAEADARAAITELQQALSAPSGGQR